MCSSDLLLRSSVCMQFTYLFRTLPPMVTLTTAESLKTKIVQFICQKFVLPELTDYAREILLLPTSLGGLGLQDPLLVALAGYFASLAGALPLLCEIDRCQDEEDGGPAILSWRNIFSDLPQPEGVVHASLNPPEDIQHSGQSYSSIK